MLIGEKIILRPLKSDDVSNLNSWRNNLALIKLTHGVRFPKTLEMDASWLHSVLTDKGNRNLYFAIEEVSTSNFIGVAQLTEIDYISGTAIYGLMIGDTTNQSKGYGSQTSQLLIDYAFNFLNLRKITSQILSYNDLSLKMFAKLGFCEEGRLAKHYFLDNQFHDILILSVFKNILV